MRVGLGVVAWSLLMVAACSDDGVPADGGENTNVTTAPTSGETGTPTTDPEGSTGDSGVTATEDPTGPSPSTSDGTTDPSGTTGPSDSSGPGLDSSTGDPSSSCEAPDDCVVVDDCCTCGAVLAGAEAPACDVLECDTTMCESYGVTPVPQCEQDSCELAPLSCSRSDALCDAEPPECPLGQAAPLDPQSGCWTGGCVPAELCDVVDDCADCPADEACIGFIAHIPSYQCTPIPEACNGAASCECLGTLCVSPFDSCGPSDNGGLSCGCDVC